MGNADGEFVLTRQQAEAITQTASGLFTYKQTGITASTTGTLLVNANPRRYGIMFSTTTTSCFILLDSNNTNANMVWNATPTAIVEILYSRHGVICQSAFWGQGSGAPATIRILELLVL